jgi:hypothetical protein
MNEIERQAIDFILRGDHPILATLRVQLSRSSVRSRESTGVGFFTQFTVPTSVPRLAKRNQIIISDVFADFEGLELGGGFLLIINDGVLDCLECHTFAEPLPPDANLRRLYYMHPFEPGSPDLVETKERDLESALSATSL